LSKPVVVSLFVFVAVLFHRLQFTFVYSSLFSLILTGGTSHSHIVRNLQRKSRFEKQNTGFVILFNGEVGVDSWTIMFALVKVNSNLTSTGDWTKG
jgi:hypothetical protein